MLYQIIYSKRKTIGLTVDAGANVVVRASPRHPKLLIDRFVNEKESWIQKAIQQRRQQQQAKKQFTQGELFLFLGNNYPLHILEQYQSRLVFNNAFYISQFKLLQAPQLFEAWYRQKAQEILLERASFYARQMGVLFKKVTVRKTVSRWGSCSAAGNINFSFRLVMAPLEIVDYVVIHELAHLVHHNHSTKFWFLVKKLCPTYIQDRKWLRTNGYMLTV